MSTAATLDLFTDPAAAAPPPPFDPKSIPVRYSRLKNMGRSPAHYLYAVTHDMGDSRAMAQGRLVHAMMLGGLEAWAIYPGERRGKAWDTFRDEHAGEEIATEKEVSVALHMAESIKRNDEAAEKLQGEHERQLSWKRAGRACTARLDVLGLGVLKPGLNHITELKVTADGQPDAFKRTALKLGYPGQLAWYIEGAEAALKVGIHHAYIVQVESKPPYVVTPMRVKANALDFGRKSNALWFERLRVCEDSGEWPGYVSGLGEFDVEQDVELSGFGEEAEGEEL